MGTGNWSSALIDKALLFSLFSQKDAVKGAISLTLILTNQEGVIIGMKVTKTREAMTPHIIFSVGHSQEREFSKVKHGPLCFGKTEEIKVKVELVLISELKKVSTAQEVGQVLEDLILTP